MDQKKTGKRTFPKIFWSGLIIILIISGVLFAKAYTFSTKIFGTRVSFFSRVAQILFNQGGARLQGEDSGQINILLLGYGGPGHDGPYLTDSMMLASIKPAEKEVLLTSIPRDLSWQTPNGNETKINEAFNDGLEGKKLNFDAGGALAETAATNLSGFEIPYFVAMDFQGFVEAINKVGGLDVTIDNTFTDSLFPNDATNGYLPPQTFTKGTEHMDGERALIFARSRHGTGIEASDFARSKRQQKILEAFKQKVQSLNILSNSSTLNDLLSILANHLHTNIEPNQLLHLASILKSPNLKVISQSLDQDSGLICPKINDSGIYVLVDCAGVSEMQIQNFFANGFQAGNSAAGASGSSANSNSAINTSDIAKEHARIILENSGTDQQLYDTTRQALKSAGMAVYEVPYRGIPLATSVLYEIDSSAPLSEKFIEQKLGIIHQPKPKQMTAKSDLVLIVGGGQ
jgi:LCP family protein required for cell wall assembly